MSRKNVRSLAAIVACMILAPLIFYSGYQFAVRAGPAIDNLTYGPGDTDTYSFVVFVDGSTYYAKNGTTRVVEYSGVSFSTVMNTAINATIDAGGGRIMLLAGDYSVDATLLITTRGSTYGFIQIWGEGKEPTTLTAANGLNDDIIRVVNSYHVGFFDFNIEGNKAAQTAGNGINITSTDGTSYHSYDIQRVEILNCFSDGIHAGSGGATPRYTKQISLYRVSCGSCGDDGVDLWGRFEFYISHSVFASNGGHGINLRGSGEGIVDGCNVFENTGSGIRVYDSTSVSVIGNFVCDNTASGILLGGYSYKIAVSACNSYGNGDYGVFLADTANNNTITGCNLYDPDAVKTQDWGVYESGTPDDNIIDGCNAQGNNAGGIRVIGAGTHVADSYNGTSWVHAYPP